MVFAEEPGLIRFYSESSVGDRTILIDGIRSELISSNTAIASRHRLDIPDSMIAQRKSPTPSTGRPVTPVQFKVIPQNGRLVIAHKSDAADIADTSDFTVNLSVVARDLTIPVSQPGAFRLKPLTLADRDTDRVADDPSFSTTAYVDVLAFKVPTGQEWIGPHGEQSLLIADDTA